MFRHITTTLLALLLLLASASSALAAPSNTIAGLEVTIHGAAQLELSNCLYPDADGGALFLAFIDNRGITTAQSYRITLHNAAGALLAARTYTALQPGDSDVFAVRVAAAQIQALDDSTRCDNGNE
jgi:hypothetical protein